MISCCWLLSVTGAAPLSAVTRSSVPSHGIRGWSQQIQASRVPSGEGVG